MRDYKIDKIESVQTFTSGSAGQEITLPAKYYNSDSVIYSISASVNCELVQESADTAGLLCKAGEVTELGPFRLIADTPKFIYTPGNVRITVCLVRN